MQDNDTLTHVYLGWNGFHLDGCNGLSEALAANTSIQHLDLTNNRIGPESLMMLCQGLKRNTQLQSLNVSEGLKCSTVRTQSYCGHINAPESMFDEKHITYDNN